MTQLEAWKVRVERKNRGHIGPLTPAQSDVLRVLRTYQPESGEPSAPSTADLAMMTQHNHFKPAKAICNRNMPEPIEPWRLHDLRRTVVTGMGPLRIDRFIKSKVLNHIVRGESIDHYDMWDYYDQKREALEKWA